MTKERLRSELEKFAEWILKNCIQHESDYWIIGKDDYAAASSKGLAEHYSSLPSEPEEQEKEPYKHPTAEQLRESLRSIPKERLDEIFNEVNAMNIQGPTIDEYFNHINGYPDTEADGIIFCGKCGKQK